MDMNELKILQNYDLPLKVIKTKARIYDAINRFGVDGLYISFSGGKDSTVLHYIVKELEVELYGEYKIPRVFCNTGLEYPELVAHVKEVFKELPDDLGIIIRPKKTFRQVLTDYGYPVISKQQSQTIKKLTQHNLSPKLRSKLLYGDEKGTAGKLSNKWHYLLEENFNISDSCCEVMKKRPFHKYDKETGRIPIVGIMADESSQRRIRYVNDGGCNAFELKNPQSRPLGFWREQDILEYIYCNNIQIPTVYGQVEKQGELYKLTGVNRTGCMFCMYGVHLEDKNNNRFLQMEKTHPKLYNYCINGGQFDISGKWIPSNKGLGLGYVLDKIGVQYSNNTNIIETDTSEVNKQLSFFKNQ